jgi:mannosyltransferase
MLLEHDFRTWERPGAVVAAPGATRRPRPTSIADRGTRIALVASATALAVALRMPFLSHQSLWYDETFTRAIVARGSLSGVLSGVHATESTPPLYYVLTWSWTQVFGLSTAMLRMPGALAGVLCVPAAYLALRRLVGVSVAIAAAFLAASSPVLVDYSLDARAYSLMVLISVLSLWATSALLQAPCTRRWGWWALSCLALLYTHYFGGMVVLAEVGVLAWKLPAQRRALTAATAAVVALALPLLPLFLHQRSSERSSFIAGLSLSGRIEEAVRQFAMGPNVPSAALEGAGIALVAAGVIAGAIALWRGTSASRLLTARTAGALLGTVFACVVLLPLALAATHLDDVFYARNLLGAWIVIAALAALGLSRARAAPLALLCVLCIATVILIQSDWRYQNVDWRGAINRFRADLAGQPVAVYGSQAAPVAAFYLHARPTTATIDTASLWVLVESARRATRALEPVLGTPAPNIPGPPFAPAGTFTFHGIRVLHFLAPRPVSVTPAMLGTDSVDGSPATLMASIKSSK